MTVARLDVLVEHLERHARLGDAPARSIQLGVGAHEDADLVRRNAVLAALGDPGADGLDLLAPAWRRLAPVGGGPLKTETVPRRSSVLPSTSDTSGPSRRSACMRIWCDVR